MKNNSGKTYFKLEYLVEEFKNYFREEMENKSCEFKWKILFHDSVYERPHFHGIIQTGFAVKSNQIFMKTS